MTNIKNGQGKPGFGQEKVREIQTWASVATLVYKCYNLVANGPDSVYLKFPVRFIVLITKCNTLG